MHRARKGSTRIGVATSMGMMLAGCGVVTPPAGSDKDAALRAMLGAAGVEAITKPATNQAKVTLGQALFFDKELSGNRNMSCSTCHTPAAFTGDGLSLSKGQGGLGLGPSRAAPLDDEGNAIFIPRNAPEVFNRADFNTMFWDARVTQHADGSFTTPAGDALLPGLDSALAAQAMFPVTSDAEMRGSPGDNELADIPGDDLPAIWAALMDRVLAFGEYVRLFNAAYPDITTENLTFAHAANAIAEFEIDHWTLTESPFDQYLRGDDSAMSASAKAGAVLFYGQAGCSSCHSGTLLTDEQFHNRCVPQLGPGKGNGEGGLFDFGRARETGDDSDRYSFRTPPLRNVAATGPWMHDGAFTTLEAVVRHELNPLTSARAYNAAQLPAEFQAVLQANQIEAIIENANPDAVMLSDEQVADMVAFMHALSDPALASLGAMNTPESVPSGLPLAD